MIHKFKNIKQNIINLVNEYKYQLLIEEKRLTLQKFKDISLQM